MPLVAIVLQFCITVVLMQMSMNHIISARAEQADVDCKSSLLEIIQEDDNLALLSQLMDETSVPEMPLYLSFPLGQEPPNGITILAMTNEAINTSFRRYVINAYSASFKQSFQNVLAYMTLLDKAYTQKDLSKMNNRYRTAFRDLPLKIEKTRNALEKDSDEVGLRTLTPFGTANILLRQNSTSDTSPASACIIINNKQVPVSVYYIDNFILPFECKNEKNKKDLGRARYRRPGGYQRYQESMELNIAKCANEAKANGLLDPTREPFIYNNGAAKWIEKD